MSEKTYYEDDGVLVTNARLVANGRTYSIDGISSCSLSRKSIGCLAPALGLFGAMVTLGGLLLATFYLLLGRSAVRSGGSAWPGIIVGLPVLVGAAVGFGILVGGIRLAKKNSSTWVVQAVTAHSGAVDLEYRDEETAKTVLRALNQAVVYKR